MSKKMTKKRFDFGINFDTVDDPVRPGSTSVFFLKKVEKVNPVLNELVPVKKPIVENHVADVEPVMLWSDDDIKKYIEGNHVDKKQGQKAKSTKYKDFSDLNIFTRFCKTVNEYKNIEEIPPPQLDNCVNSS